MQIENDDYDSINIGAIEIKALLLEAKERIKQNALHHENYIGICKSIEKEVFNHKEYTIEDDILCWNKRIYAPEKLRSQIIKSEYDSKVSGPLRRGRTLELVCRNFYWPQMEHDMRKYFNECDNCQRTKSPRHAKYGMLHTLQLARKRWTHISTHFKTDLPVSDRATMILVVVDLFTKMAHFIPLQNKDSPTMA
jgi:hypothetical protein